MPGVEINYLAAIVCGISSMVIGAIWYGPLFGKAWMKEVGKTEEELKENFNPAKTYSLAFIGSVVVAIILGYFLSLTNASTIIDSIRVSLAAWVGFVAAIFFINALFEGKSNKLLMINTLYHLINLVVFGIILIVW